MIAPHPKKHLCNILLQHPFYVYYFVQLALILIFKICILNAKEPRKNFRGSSWILTVNDQTRQR